MKKKKILITGSNGFIGKNLSQELRNDYEVFGIGRKNIKQKNYYKINLNNQKKINEIFSKIKFDIVIHCAWYTKHDKYRNSKLNYKYLEYSKFLLDTYIKNGGKNFIGIGTCEEYEKKKNSRNLFYEKSKIRPINLYARCKNLFHIYLKKKKINYKWLRFFYLFGEGENKKRLFPLIVRNLNSNRKIKLRYPNLSVDFLYIKNATKIIKNLIKKKLNGEFNICSGQSVKLNDLVNFNINKKINSKNKDFEEIRGSIKKLQESNCFIKFDFNKSLKKYIKSFKDIAPKSR